MSFSHLWGLEILVCRGPRIALPLARRAEARGVSLRERSMVAMRRSPPNLYGWLVVAVSFAALSLVFSARSSLGLAMPVWEQDLGWSRATVSLGGAAALVTMSLVAPLAGNLVDRFGPRALLALGLAAAGCGMTAVAGMRHYWEFVAAFSLLGGIGFGTVATHVVATAIARYFSSRRGLATGVATAGSTAGQLIVVPVLALVLAAIGWRASFLALGVAALVLAPVAWWLLRPREDGAPRQAHAPAAQPLGARIGVLLRSPVFYALFGSFTICGFTTSGVIETHLLPYAAACGFPPLPSATAYGVLSGVNMLGMVLAGYLSDRVNRPLLLGAIYILRGLSFLLLMRIAGDLPLLFLFAVMFGLFDYSTVPVTASLVASHLGLRIMGLTMGILSAGHAAGAAVGALLGGVFYDLFARYEAVWIASIGLAVVAGFMVFTIREGRDTGAVPLATPA